MKTIIMADVVGSSKQKANALMKTFRKLTDEVNQDAKQYIVSPLTVTLGDEFQGIVTDLTGAVNILIMFEEKIIRSGQSIKLRYVIHQGEIATPVNTHSAHGMLGKGLTDARAMLTEMKSSKERFRISLKNPRLTEQLNLIFKILQRIVDGWTASQRKIVSAFLQEADYRKVASRLKKDPTAMWRRKRSLMIEEYGYLKRLILLCSGAV